VRNILIRARERGVFRTAGAYIAGGYVFLEVCTLLFPILGVPESALSLVLVLLVAGFPGAVLAAWHLDLSFDGSAWEFDVPVLNEHTSMGRVFDGVVIAALLLIVGFLVWDNYLTPKTVIDTRKLDGEKSIAVLPFAEFTNDADSAYLGDGISEEIINALSGSQDLKVTARTSAFAFKGQDVGVKEIAKALEVRHVLDGSVRTSNGQLRITAQLIDADTGYQLWSQTFDRPRDDIFVIQEEIATAVLRATNASLFDSHHTEAYTQDLEAYKAYQLGLKRLELRSEEGVFAAIRLFRTAVDEDPNFADAQAALAEALLTSSDRHFGIGLSDFGSIVNEAERAIEQALKLSPNDTTVIAIRGLLSLFDDKPEEALTYFDRALEQSPNLALVHYWRSIVLDDDGAYGEAKAAMEKAYALNPLAPDIAVRFVDDLVLQGKFEEAEQAAAKLREHQPKSGAGYHAGFLTAMAQAKIADAHDIALKGVGETRREQRLLDDLSEIYVLLGMQDALGSVGGAIQSEIDLMINEGQCEEARPLAEADYRLAPDEYDALKYFAAATACAGKVDEAKALYEELLGDEDNVDLIASANDFALSDLAFMRQRNGDQEGADKLIALIKQDRNTNAENWGAEYRHLAVIDARIAALEGNVEEAVRRLNEGLDAGLDAPSLRMEYLFNSLKSDARYKSFYDKYTRHLEAQKKEVIQQRAASAG